MFAAAIGFLGLASVLRSGGAAYFMQSMTERELVAHGRPFFWWSALFLGTSAALMFLASWDPVLQGWIGGTDVGHTSRMSITLAMLGVRQLLTPITQVGRLQLAAQHRFTRLATLDSANAVIRLLATVALAANGFGVLALAIPYALQTGIEFAWLVGSGSLSIRDLLPPQLPRTSDIRQLIWPSITSIFNATNQQIVLLLLSKTLPLATVGEFYFASQIAMQPMVLLPSALQGVLAPLMAARRDSAAAVRDLAESVMRGAMLFAPVTTLAAASLFPSIELVLWGGRWSKLQIPMFLLSAGVAYATTASLMVGPMIGLRQYKAAAALEGSRAAVTVLGTVLGAWLAQSGRPPWAAAWSEVTVISATFGGALLVSSVIQLVWLAKKLGINSSSLARDLSFGPALATLTALAAQALGSSVMTSLDVPPSRLAHLMNLVIVASVYLALITLAVRFTAESTLRDMVALLPHRARSQVQALLRL